MEIAAEDRDKTAFVSHHGLFRLIQILFGLKNAPGTFQCAMDVSLSRVKWQFTLFYLDDIVVFSRLPNERIDQVRQVLTLLRNAGVTLKLRKCEFFTNSIDFLGHVIRPGQLEVSSHTVDVIRDLKPPTNFTELRSFLE